MKIDFDFINIKDFSFEEIRLVTTVSPPPLSTVFLQINYVIPL